MSETPAPRTKRKALAYVFWALAGVFGAHRLYYEKWVSGGAQLGLLFAGFSLAYFRAEFPAGLYFYSIPLNVLGLWLMADAALMLFWRPAPAPQDGLAPKEPREPS